MNEIEGINWLINARPGIPERSPSRRVEPDVQPIKIIPEGVPASPKVPIEPQRQEPVPTGR